jgi:hypothetical protein
MYLKARIGIKIFQFDKKLTKNTGHNGKSVENFTVYVSHVLSLIVILIYLDVELLQT